TDFQRWGEMWRRYETTADLQITNDQGVIPTRNWQTGQFEGWRGVDKSTTNLWGGLRKCGPVARTVPPRARGRSPLKRVLTKELIATSSGKPSMPSVLSAAWTRWKPSSLRASSAT